MRNKKNSKTALLCLNNPKSVGHKVTLYRLFKCLVTILEQFLKSIEF